jgi:biotin operon repressor
MTMSTIRDRGEAVRRFIIDNVAEHTNDIVRLATEKFSCSRQAVHKHIQRLVEEGAITESGHTRNKAYSLAPLVQWSKDYPLTSGITEDQVWRDDVSPSLGPMPKNVSEIWHYGFTEMFNNAIDHSEGTAIHVEFRKTAANTTIQLFDNGIGIFRKIQAALKLIDERHSVLELAKGKFTTDPANHSGEGIFFSSRMFDGFEILSGGVFFAHEFDEKEDWILEPSNATVGTMVTMALNNHTSRSYKKVFDKFSADDDYGFTKTVVPVKLTRYGDDNLVSRSQAKRLLSRIDRFKVVVFDFAGVASIGQAFADEVFRVFAARYPGIEIATINASTDVKKMISRARAVGEQ